MPIRVTEIRFYQGRKHIIKGRPQVKTNSSAFNVVHNLTPQEKNERKQATRAKRAEEIKNSKNLQDYIDWICGIQNKLGLNTERFAQRIGISAQMVKLWKSKRGHFPSERSFRRLLELERESEIKVTVVKAKFGIKNGRKK